MRIFCAFFVEEIVKDIEFCIEHVKDSSIDEFNADEVLSSTISFKFVQISENAKKLS